MRVHATVNIHSLGLGSLWDCVRICLHTCVYVRVCVLEERGGGGGWWLEERVRNYINQIERKNNVFLSKSSVKSIMELFYSSEVKVIQLLHLFLFSLL